MTINSPTYGLPLSGTYHADNPYTYPPTPSTTRTASIPATHKKPIPSHTTP